MPLLVQSSAQTMTISQSFRNKRSRSSTNTASFCYSLVVFILIFAILFYNEGDCETPIRLWLEVCAYTALVGCLLPVLSETLIRKCNAFESTRLSNCIICIHCLYIAFYLFWFFLGNIWFYSDEKCEEEFYAGYLCTLLILIFSYIVIGGVLCLVCSLACRMAGVLSDYSS